MLRKFWSDPVWSKVIETGIIALASSAIVYFAGWWPRIVRAGVSAVAYMGHPTSVPTWLLVLLAVCSIVVAVRLVAIVWSAIFPPEARQLLSFKSYTEDYFFNLRWRWRYDGNVLYGIVPFCPDCDLQLNPADVSSYRIVDHIAIRCEECEITWGDFEVSWGELENRVQRKIHQKLRAGTWQEAVQRMLERRVGSGQ